MDNSPTEASENTPLILQGDETGGSADPEDGQESGDSTNGFDHYVDVFDELERPWPATFERSISLLAGPTMDTKFIDDITKSPKITPSLTRRRVRDVYFIHVLLLVLHVKGVLPKWMRDFSHQI